jgi:AcrR family transcriptional regulator
MPGDEVAIPPQAAAAADARQLWFSPPDSDASQRRALTRERVVTEALTIISTDSLDALSMRGLAARLGVVPGALYRHVRSKDHLRDLVVDGVLAEVDCQAARTLDWSEQVMMLASRLRAVLELHPGIAGLLKTRDPLGPQSRWP